MKGVLGFFHLSSVWKIWTKHSGVGYSETGEKKGGDSETGEMQRTVLPKINLEKVSLNYKISTVIYEV